MTSLMTSLILFSCWARIAKCRAGDLSDEMLDFYSVFNGHCNNFEQNNHGEGSKDKLEGIFREVLVPAWQKDPMLYIEESVNGRVYRMVVGAVTKRPGDNIFYITLFNFTNPSDYTPGSFNTDDLANFPREAFRRHQDCDAEFLKVSRGVYTGSWSDCNDVIDKKHPAYGLTITCENVFSTLPVESHEAPSRAPIIAKFTGARYPLIGAPKDYVSLCKDNK